MLKVGDKAPYFKGVDQSGDTIDLDSLKGKRIILYFYPKDLTPGCTVQAMNLTANLKDLSKRGYVILGVSADSEKRHCSFADKVGIGFSLLADEDMSIIKSYGVWGPKKFMGRNYDGIRRWTFLIDDQGKIEHIIDKVKTKSHAQQIIDWEDNKNK